MTRAGSAFRSGDRACKLAIFRQPLRASRLLYRSAMKKTSRKLALQSEAIRVLAAPELDRVAGGTFQPVQPEGFIMKDSIIVKTSTR